MSDKPEPHDVVEVAEQHHHTGRHHAALEAIMGGMITVPEIVRTRTMDAC